MKPKDYIERNIREICSGFVGPFTSDDVYEKLRNRVKIYPTTLEFRHKLPRMPFIEKAGKLGDIGVNSRTNLYRYRGRSLSR